MQDRYLFRGKRIDNGEWEIGYLYCTQYHAYISNDCADMVEVDKDTICQCTGLRDKTDKLIFENDIVRHYNNPSRPNDYVTGLIYFDEKNLALKRTSRMYENVGIRMCCIYEVVGNKFDNPGTVGGAGMTESEAIGSIKYRMHTAENKVGVGNGMKDLDMAIKALEKQIPKKPILDVIYEQQYYCPNCKLYVAKKKEKKPHHCIWCGQALDWSGQE